MTVPAHPVEDSALLVDDAVAGLVFVPGDYHGAAPCLPATKGKGEVEGVSVIGGVGVVGVHCVGPWFVARFLAGIVGNPTARSIIHILFNSDYFTLFPHKPFTPFK